MSRKWLSSVEPISKKVRYTLKTFKMSDHFIIDMGFVPLIRQNALTVQQWSRLIAQIIVPRPANAVLIEDHDYDTDSDAGWYPDERDVEQGY